MSNKRIAVACLQRSECLGGEDKQRTQTLEQLFAGSNVLLIAVNFTHPWIEWNPGNRPHNAAGDMSIRWLEDRVLTRHERGDTWLRLGRHLPILDLPITKYDNGVQSLCCYTVREE